MSRWRNKFVLLLQNTSYETTALSFATKFGQFAWKLLRFSIFKMKMPALQTYDDYLEDILSYDMAQEAVADRSLNSSNMFDFLIKEEHKHTGKDDLRALRKDRHKKDNHNKSKFFNWLLKTWRDKIFIDLELDSIASALQKYLLTCLLPSPCPNRPPSWVKVSKNIKKEDLDQGLTLKSHGPLPQQKL